MCDNREIEHTYEEGLEQLPSIIRSSDDLIQEYIVLIEEQEELHNSESR